MGAQASRQLLEAASSGDMQRLHKALSTTDVDIADQDGWTALHYGASSAGGHAVVHALLRAGADANTRDKAGRTPLHLAALRGHTEAVAALCNHGADVDARDNDGAAPLHKAVVHRRCGTAEALVRCRAYARLALPDGTTPLHLAACVGDTGMLPLLLAAGAELEAQNCDGQTPLFEAAAAGHAEAVRWLMQAHADPGHRDKEGRTVADVAATPVVAALLNRGVEALPQPAAEAPSTDAAQQVCPSAGRGWPWARLCRRAQVAPSPAAAPLPPPAAQHAEAGSSEVPSADCRAALSQEAAVPSAPPLPDTYVGDQERAPMLPAPPTQWQMVEAAQQPGALEPAIEQPVQGPVAAEAIAAPGTVAWSAHAATAAMSAAWSALGSLQWMNERPQSPTRSNGLSPVRRRRPQRQSGRCWWDDEDFEEVEVQDVVPAGRQTRQKHHQGSSLQRQAPAPEPSGSPCRLFSYEELWEATGGFRSRVDAEGSLSGSYLGHMPAQASKRDGGSVEIVARALQWVPPDQALRRGHAARLAELAHPHLLPLLGVCEQSRHVVYERMPRGSLDDALHGRLRGGSSSAAPVRLDWCTRMRIAAEATAGLLHLHGAGLAHARLQPSTILLDGSLRARLGDAGLPGLFGAVQVRRALPYVAPEVAAAAGGGAAGRSADLFSLGLVVLQLLTGSAPVGLAQHVQSVAAGGAADVARIVDPCAGACAQEDAAELCQLALRCMAQDPGARPSLGSEVLPALSRLAGRAESAAAHAAAAAGSSRDPPAILICPITHEVMQDPVVAADGHSYERTAIQQWLDAGHRTSPMTNLRLPHRQLTPNHSLRSAALEWQAARRTKAA